MITDLLPLTTSMVAAGSACQQWSPILGPMHIARGTMLHRGKGELFNIYTNEWEEPDADEKELLLGYSKGDTAAPGVTDAERSVRLGRALDGHVMRWLGATLHASQA